MTKFVPCRNCATLEGSKPEGYIYDIVEGFQVIRECECHRTWRRSILLETKAKEASLWTEVENLNYSPTKNYVGSQSLSQVGLLQRYVLSFAETKFNSASVYMFGPYGTQKTHLAQWAGISLLKKGFSVRYSSMQRLVSNLSSEFDSNLEKQKLVEELLSVDCLILDECFSKTKVTLYKSGYQLPFLETFLRERMEHRQRAIIFISNNTLDEIASQGFGESIEDFVKRNIRPKGTELKFTDSYRANVSTIDVDNIFKE